MIHWRREITDGVHTIDMYGTQPVAFNSSGDFTPYDKISFPQVCGWLENAMGATVISQLDAALEARLVAMLAPAIVDPGLPWVGESLTP
jgi:hypothetical protein